MEIELFHSDGRTDMTKLTLAFHNFAKARTNYEDTCVYCISKSDKICIANSWRDDLPYGCSVIYLKMIQKSAETCRQW